jgi:hypothetical protein
VKSEEEPSEWTTEENENLKKLKGKREANRK